MTLVNYKSVFDRLSSGIIKLPTSEILVDIHVLFWKKDFNVINEIRKITNSRWYSEQKKLRWFKFR